MSGSGKKYTIRRLDGPGSGASAEKQAREAAARFRSDHHLAHQPLGDLAVLIEQTTSIDVAVLDGELDEHGLTVRDPVRGTVFIGVARTPHPMRQRSSLAHELAHVLFEDWASGELPPERSSQEVRADAFARHLLVPVDGLGELLGTPRHSVGPAVLSQVVQRFLVSPRMAAIALRDAGYIDDATQQSWRTITTPGLAARYGWADQYHALCVQSAQRRAPQQLLARAIDGYLAHVVSLQTIATLRGTTPAEVETEFREAGIVPVDQTIAWADAADLPAVDIDLSALDEIDDVEGFADPSTNTPPQGEAG